jgi:hypothetical protein
MSFAAFLAEDRRLVILRVLREAPAYAANGSVLHAAIGRLGHDVARDLVRSDVAWLAEQGLVKVEEIAGAGVTVATLTERGLDVAEARAVVPGVRRPAPGR